ncbi:PH domain-containing protein [Aquimarina brevivitae]|uniref:PH (Pleckstrin Homology) domain-containing protein n=1 Tax=Aquimarina brevivitae TaxID=323412 RepID=A0A4Q7NXZ5_9FLAO|nr:PH domain-containing protein [Aquimarina brevivitae]RZS91880.1 PH (Pleckstrin Homology) domain-containing protein [Aquimarina brevivitae]
MTFKTRRDPLFSLILLAVVIFLVYIFTIAVIEMETFEAADIFTSTLVIVVLIFLIWSYLDTRYIITNDKLKYICGPIRGTINIEDINKITLHKTLWVGFRPAMARKGIIIHYQKFDQLYISPSSNQSFADYLTSLNPKIIVD